MEERKHKIVSKNQLLILSLFVILVITVTTYVFSQYAIELEKPDKANTLRLANEAYDRNDFLTSASLYKRYIDKFDSNNLNVLIDYGYSLHNTGKSDQGVELLESVISKDADNSFALFNLAVIHFQKGRKQQAIDYLKQCAEKGDSPEIAQKAQMFLEQMNNPSK